jgi:hypothetical protein
MANPDIETQFNAAQAAADIICNKLENLQGSDGTPLEQQAKQILDQVNRLQAIKMVACTADISAQTPKVTAAKDDLQKLFQSDADITALINGGNMFLTVVTQAVQTASKAII